MKFDPRYSKLAAYIKLISAILSIAMILVAIFNKIFPNKPFLDTFGHTVPIPVWSIVLVISLFAIFWVRYGARSSRVSVKPEGSPTDPNLLRYRDSIMLKHLKSGFFLYTHNKPYTHQGTSGQFQVEAIPTTGLDGKDQWIIKTQHGSNDEKRNQPVSHSDTIRLENVTTRRNLHSHGLRAPITSTQSEVTAFGQDGFGDTNDNWQILLIDDGRQVKKGDKIRLIHVNTTAALHSNPGVSHQTYTSGLQEVTSSTARDENDYWIIINMATLKDNEI
jgi:dolichyl-phosphate-mannose--protein O-mannosyl transferase